MAVCAAGAGKVVDGGDGLLALPIFEALVHQQGQLPTATSRAALASTSMLQRLPVLWSTTPAPCWVFSQ